jgi:hypothetical protein
LLTESCIIRPEIKTAGKRRQAAKMTATASLTLYHRSLRKSNRFRLAASSSQALWRPDANPGWARRRRVVEDDGAAALYLH